MIVKYIQKLPNINTENVIKLTFSIDEWWDIQNIIIYFGAKKKFERLGSEYFEDLAEIFIKEKINILSIEENKPRDYLTTLEIPREFLRMLVYPIGKRAYDIDSRGEYNIEAQVLLDKINKQIQEQLDPEDKWFKRNW